LQREKDVMGMLQKSRTLVSGLLSLVGVSIFLIESHPANIHARGCTWRRRCSRTECTSTRLDSPLPARTHPYTALCMCFLGGCRRAATASPRATFTCVRHVASCMCFFFREREGKGVGDGPGRGQRQSTSTEQMARGRMQSNGEGHTQGRLRRGEERGRHLICLSFFMRARTAAGRLGAPGRLTINCHEVNSTFFTGVLVCGAEGGEPRGRAR
jgi:hypothetical protein